MSGYLNGKVIKSNSINIVEKLDEQNHITDINDDKSIVNVEALNQVVNNQLGGSTHTSITNIDLKSTGVLNEYIVEITWVDENGISNVTTDPTPIVIGSTNSTDTFIDTNSIDFTKTGTDVKADVKVSTTQGQGITTTIETDGLKVTYDETPPPSFISRAAALTALGTGKKFQYLITNLDGAVEGTVAWT